MSNRVGIFLLIVSLVIAGMFLFGRKVYVAVIGLTDSQKKMRDLIADLSRANGYKNVAFLQGLALEESSLNPTAKSTKTSYGLFQIYHSTNFSWLRWAGYKDADLAKLYDPVFNTNLAVKILRYFEQRGFSFPGQIDIYNVGETEWSKGKRNEDYRNKVIAYTQQFNGGTL